MLLSVIGLLVGLPLFILIAGLCLLDTGSPIFRQKRVGRSREPFILYKFRTMALGTPSVSTHLANSAAVTKLGKFLRHTKLDELPQLWNVLRGDMSLVGPRPCLLNQVALIQEREFRNVFSVRPGIVGLSQLKGIDMSSPAHLAESDARMIAEFTLSKYFHYVVLAVIGVGSGDRIR